MKLKMLVLERKRRAINNTNNNTLFTIYFDKNNYIILYLLYILYNGNTILD